MQAIFATLILLAVVFFGIRVVMLLRPATTKDQTDNIGDTCASDLTRNLEELRISNDISEAEFRTIKSVLEKRHADSIGHNYSPARS